MIYISWLSVIMACVSIVMMGGLVLSRALETKMNGDRQPESDMVMRLMIRFVSTHDETELLSKLRPVKCRILAHQASYVLGLVRGDVTKRLLAVFEALGLRNFEQASLLHGTFPDRLRAAEFLANFDDRESESSLRRALGDRSLEVRIAVAISLAHRNALSSEEVLKVVIHNGNSSRRIAELFEVIAAKLPEVVKGLICNVNTPLQIRALAIEGLSRNRSSAFFGFFERMLQASCDATVIAAFVRSVGLLQNPKSLEVIRPYLAHVDWTVQLAAVEAVGLLGTFDDDLCNKLCVALENKNWQVRQAATTALVAMGPKGLSRLRTLASDPKGLRRGLWSVDTTLTVVKSPNV